MKFTDIPELTKHYEKIISDSVAEIEKLNGEIQESRAAIDAAEKKAKEAAKTADTEKYLRERNIVTMHEQRINMHKVRIVDLKYKHLIDKQEFDRLCKEIEGLRNELTNGNADRFMQHYEEMRAISLEHEQQMLACRRLYALIKEKVYRKPDITGNDIDRASLSFFNGFRNVVRLLDDPNQNWSIDVATIKRAATNALKARTLRKLGGMEKKADRIMKS